MDFYSKTFQRPQVFRNIFLHKKDQVIVTIERIAMIEGSAAGSPKKEVVFVISGTGACAAGNDS